MAVNVEGYRFALPTTRPAVQNNTVPPAQSVVQDASGGLTPAISSAIAQAAGNVGQQAAGMSDYAITTSVENQLQSVLSPDQEAAVRAQFTNYNQGTFSNAATSAQVQDWITQISDDVASVWSPSVAAAAPLAPAPIPTPAQVIADPTSSIGGQDPTAPDPLQAAFQSLTSQVAALTAELSGATNSGSPSTGDANGSTPSTATDGSSSATNTQANTSATDTLASQLVAGLTSMASGGSNGVAGSGSIGGGIGVPDVTAGTTPLTQTPRTSSGPDLAIVGVVLGIAGLVFAVWWYTKDHKHGAPAAAAA